MNLKNFKLQWGRSAFDPSRIGYCLQDMKVMNVVEILYPRGCATKIGLNFLQRAREN